MTRIGLVALLGAFAVSPLFAGPDNERTITTTVAVQSALLQAREAILYHNYGTAVMLLEGQLPYIDGNREYLVALRDAYRGYISDLRLAKKDAEVQMYLRRLAILDPTVVCPTVQAKPTATEPPAPIVKQPSQPIQSQTQCEDDPFSYDNSTQKQAKALLEKAEEAFAGKRYAEAGRLYEQAYQADPSVVAGSRDRWAFCKLKNVLDRLNRERLTSSNLEALASMEHEVRQALSLSPPPQMETLGKDLLRTIQERRLEQNPRSDRAAPVAVRHLPPQDGYSVAESANFRIYHKKPQDMAEQIASVAESTRTRHAAKMVRRV